MYNNPILLENIRSSYLYELLSYNSKLYPGEELKEYFLLFHSDLPLNKRRRYYIDPMDYGLPVWNLKKLSESALILREITRLYNKDDFTAPEWLRKRVISYFKVLLTGTHSPVELYISERNTRQIFEVPLTKLHLYRKAGLLKVDKQNESYCYPLAQLQELFG